jgi:hypothetical protein
MMSNVIQFPNKKPKVSVNIDTRQFGTIRGQMVRKPQTAQQFLDLCKDQLEVDDYMDVLCSIMDEEHYDAMEDCIQNLVHVYRTFKS